MTVRSLGLALCLAACIRTPPAPDARRSAEPPRVTPSPPAPTPAPDPTITPAPALTTPVRFVVRVSGGAAEGDRLPLVIAIHGLGDSPEGFIGFVTQMGLRLRVAAPAGLERYEDGYAWFPSRMGTPHAQWVAGIRRATDALIPAIARVAAAHPTCGLPVVTGFSQGGFLSYAIVARPEAHVFAALPMGGLLPQELWPAARDIGGMLPGVYAFHGTDDPRVPLAMDRAANEAFRAVGHPVELHEYPGVGHTVSQAMAFDVRRRLIEVIGSHGCPLDG